MPPVGLDGVEGGAGVGAGLGAGAGGFAIVTSTSSQFGPRLALAARTRTVPVRLPIVSTPVRALMLHPRALPWIEK